MASQPLAGSLALETQLYHLLLGGALVLALIGVAIAVLVVLPDADVGIRMGQMMGAMGFITEGVGLGIGAIGVHYASWADPFSWVACSVGLGLVIAGWRLIQLGDRAERRARLTRCTQPIERLRAFPARLPCPN